MRIEEIQLPVSAASTCVSVTFWQTGFAAMVVIVYLSLKAVPPVGQLTAYSPWLTAPVPVGACVGGVPPTPGKVTGGGQIQGDPIFSPLGELLSVPALMPSLPDPNAKVSFGFVVQCCPATGNLEYNDKFADVRIKATSVSGLFISDGTCGPNTHATVTGTADVIRSTGTTSEPFTVEVDDCGEPGTADTFSIKTTTYSNGPSTLIGGNIQIHKSP